ncbi:MAG: methylenetetrahydromethanopterin dehydrogenase [Planctomycetota bacterium]|jgi:methylenetetrahydromethanopterin dehydrogenase
MTDRIFKLAVAKFGCIGAAPLLDLILDERADRDDLEVRGFTSGAKLDPESCKVIVEQIIDYVPDLIVIVSPNAALPGATAARETLADAKIPTITISDGPSKKAFIGKDENGKAMNTVSEGQGFIILPSDPMIGARREFLDPTEMSIFNGDVIKVLAACGVIRYIQFALDKVVNELKQGNTAEMPCLVANAEDVVSQAGFTNPYAAAKAIAALTMSETVARLTTKGCFMVKEADKYIPLVAAGHEVLRAAVMLADEAREMEKSMDMVNRTPHSSSGETRQKNRLGDKPA